MNKPVDQFFKDNLQDHSRPASAEVWQRIEATLSKKNNPIIWWRAAAVVGLLGALLWAGYLWQGNNNSQPMLTNKIIEPLKPVEERPLVDQKGKQEVKTQKTLAKKENKKSINKNLPSQAIQVENNSKEITAIVIEENVEAIELVAVHTAKIEKPIVLEFTLEPVQPTPLIIAHSEEKKQIKNLLTVARDLKNGESQMDLQTLKQNLFALNFRKDKKSTENNQ